MHWNNECGAPSQARQEGSTEDLACITKDEHDEQKA